jgi:hypothetical protein
LRPNDGGEVNATERVRYGTATGTGGNSSATSSADVPPFSPFVEPANNTPRASPPHVVVEHVHRVRTPTAQPPVAERIQPLAEATVAQRALLARRESRPVVQVTIDRLEVRAPAQAPAPATAQKPRTTSTLPLSDYLRRRARDPQAGGSA